MKLASMLFAVSFSIVWFASIGAKRGRQFGRRSCRPFIRKFIHRLLARASTGGASSGAGTTLSNGVTVNGTGGAPGANTSNAKSQGITGNNLGPRERRVPRAS